MIKITLTVLAGVAVALMIYLLMVSRMQDRCLEVEVEIKSFDVCIGLPGCFFDADHIHRVGKAIQYKQDHCPLGRNE